MRNLKKVNMLRAFQFIGAFFVCYFLHSTLALWYLPFSCRFKIILTRWKYFILCCRMQCLGKSTYAYSSNYDPPLLVILNTLFGVLNKKSSSVRIYKTLHVVFIDNCSSQDMSLFAHASIASLSIYKKVVCTYLVYWSSELYCEFEIDWSGFRIFSIFSIIIS